MARRLLAGLVAVAAILGMWLYTRSSTHREVEARLVELCADDAGCLAAVRQHYDACFDSTFSMSGRRQASHLDVDSLVKCVNEKAGKPYFKVDRDAR
jgi:hypothetical protein